jgi:cytidine deaminase
MQPTNLLTFLSTSMREFTTPSFPVFMYDGQGNYAVRTMGEVSSPFIADSFFHIATCYA